jgi:hypothetical protein
VRSAPSERNRGRNDRPAPAIERKYLRSMNGAERPN